MELDLEKANAELRDLPAAEIVAWTLALNKRTITTTSFGRNSAVMLHLVSRQDKSMPVVWVDTGYNLRDTYLVAERLISELELNMRIHSPEMTAERRNAIMGGVPTIQEEELHKAFTEQVKLEPFAKALDELKPEVWLSGIRREETEYRQGLDIVTVDERGLLKVSPVFHWSEADMNAYMAEHNLPTCRHYFDPTKVDDGRECGLHTTA